MTLDLSFISILTVSFQMLINIVFAKFMSSLTCLPTPPCHLIPELAYSLLNVVAPSRFGTSTNHHSLIDGEKSE